MNLIPNSIGRLMALAMVLLGLVYVLPACASQAGQLTATEMAPLVRTVAGDLEEYVDAGIEPDGSAMSAARQYQIRSSIVLLQNALRKALREELLPLPTLDPTATDDGTR